MSQVVTATFEDGVLKPDAPLGLAPRTRVRLVLDLIAGPENGRDGSWDELERVWAESPVDSGAARPPRDQLHDRG